MAKPAILAVDDDLPVLRSIERDLRSRYATDYRIVAANSGQEALDAAKQLTARGDVVALFLVDQRMPGMSGIELLAATAELQPDAKRVLLTAYADTDVAIRAINEIRLDQYLLKPWDPPEERLYPSVDDLLEDWTATNRPGVEGPRLLARRWSPRGFAIRDYLTRNQVPYTWLDPEADEEGRRLTVALGSDPSLPVVLLPDGSTLTDPSNRELAERVGLSTHAALPFYDLAIVGGGPAGMAAAVYGASEGLATIMIEREAPGGQAGTTSRIENYLGFPSGLSGADLARRALAQARRLGAELLASQEVRTIRRNDPYRTLVLEDGAEVSCQAVIVATGVSYRQLTLEGADRLAGAGLYYGAATTDAIVHRGAQVGVVGGGNSAGQAAVHLSRFAERVHLFVRTDALSGMSQYLIDQIAAIPQISVHTRTSVAALHGGDRLVGISVEGPEGPMELPVTACFIFIGQRPRTEWLEGVVARDAGGFLLTGEEVLTDGRPPAGWGLPRPPLFLETSLPGVFAAGDVRHRSVKRIASAVGEGAMAVQLVHQYLLSL